MINLAPGIDVPDSELVYRASRAGGPGGQHVNKTESRIELTWNVASSAALAEPVRQRLLEKLRTRLDSQGTLRIVAASERSQRQNRAEALERLQALVRKALAPVKRRKITRPTAGSRERRLGEKRRRSELKSTRRRRPEPDA